MCGRKRATTYRGHLGLVGLGVVLVALYALSVTQVPVLSFQSGVPSSVIYTPQAIVGSQIPPTPQGWLVNSTTALNSTRPLNLSTTSPIGDIYAVKQVYVPSYHPETENYTLYYEVSAGEPIVGDSWRPMPGWNYSSSVSQALPLQGRLFVYTSPRATLLVYAGKEQLYFITGTSIELLNVGVSVTRQFEGTTVPSATSVFTSDLQGLFQPGLTSETYYSAWTGYFARVDQTASAVYGLLALMSSAGLILWSAYRVELSDTKRDSFVTSSSELDDEDYAVLATQLEAGRANRTGNDIAALTGVGQQDARGLARIFNSLKELEKNGLVKAALVESGSDLLLKWKAAA